MDGREPAIARPVRTAIAGLSGDAVVAHGNQKMEPYQQRVVDEKEELDGRRLKLIAFVSGPKFESVPIDEQERMHEQIACMSEYSDVLRRRIEAF